VGRGWRGIAIYSIGLKNAPAAYGGCRWEPTFLLAPNKAIGAPVEMLQEATLYEQGLKEWQSRSQAREVLAFWKILLGFTGFSEITM
jgi:hypothetical protein